MNHLLIVHTSFATNRSGEGLTLETSVFKLFSYGGQSCYVVNSVVNTELP